MHFVVVKTNLYSKLTKAVLTVKATASMVVAILHEHWIILYRIFGTAWTDNGTQFVSKLIAGL